MLRILFFVLLTVTTALAQDRDELLRTYRNEWSGTPLDAVVFERFIDVQADPDWWAYLVSNSRKGKQFVYLADGLLDVAKNLGWGDAQDLDGSTGRKADSPPLLELLDSWKGKLSVRIALPKGLTQEQKDVVVDNLALLNSPMGNKYANLPRGGKFLLNVSFNPKAKEMAGKVSKDGTTFDFVFPVYAGVTTMPLENIFKKGLK